MERTREGTLVMQKAYAKQISEGYYWLTNVNADEAQEEAREYRQTGKFSSVIVVDEAFGRDGKRIEGLKVILAKGAPKKR